MTFCHPEGRKTKLSLRVTRGSEAIHTLLGLPRWTFVLLAITNIFLFMTFPVFAEEDCTNPKTQTDMNICSGIALENADKKLNEIYKKAIDLLDEKEKSQLKDNQRAWLTYRDLTCEFETRGSESGGTIWPFIYADCMTRLTKQRSEEIPHGFMEWGTEE